MPSLFQDYAACVKPSLDAAFSDRLASLLGDTGPSDFPEEIQLLTGGKKIRGTLLCLVNAALGGTLEDALPRAVAVELIQTASLIHDDYVDQHRSRRNSAAIWTLEGARKAVLLGDVVFASAIQMMSELGREDGLIVSRTIAEVSRGAYREPLDPSALLREIEVNGVDGALYEKIIYLKTGVLFGTACELGAIAAKADNGLRSAWRGYGLKIGEAYQIADDLHEVERSLATRSITADEMTSLAPALLFFAGEARPYILQALRQQASALGGEILEHFRAAAELMKREKERRLQSAVAGIDGVCDGALVRLARKAPWDLIRMFDEAGSTASLP